MSGTVTLLFSDIEGSTRLLQRLGEQRFAATLQIYRERSREVFTRWGGREVDSVGDAFFAVFDRASSAVSAALETQRTVEQEPWPDGARVRVRIALHTGEPILDGDRYVGLDVHRAARLCEAGHGGQALLTAVTRELVERDLPSGVSLGDLGWYRLRDLAEAEHVFQLVAPDIPLDLRPLRALSVRGSNLPVRRGPLIGREHDIAAAEALLLREDVGLLTLSGPAGTGKTSLAVEVAAAVQGSFPDGVYFVELAPISQPGLVISAIVRTLGLQEAGGVPLEETLKAYLRDRQTLLLLDNFEQVLEAAQLVAELLAACRRLKILVTSRAVLRLYGEHDLPVPPLEMPEAGRRLSAEAMARYPAVNLFGQRAAAAKPDFALSSANTSAVVEICRRLDGLPLAIELAAARVRLLSPRAMLSRLEHRLALAASGPSDLPPRQQTLRGAIGWSYDLLDAAERALFRRLSVFVGGWTLESAAALQEPDAAGAAPDLLDLHGSLVAKSLVRQQEDSSGEPRFSMLETIREFGMEQVEQSGEEQSLRRRHAEYFLALAEEGERLLGGPQQAEWLARLDAEHPNLRSALSWSLASGEQSAELSQRLAGALWVFWFRRGYLSEGSRWLQQALAQSPGITLERRAKLLTADGSIARLAGEFARAEPLLEQGAALYRELGDHEGVAWALSHLGLVKQWLGHLDLGVDMLEESLALRRPLGNQRDIARSLFNLGVAEDFRASYDRAAQRYTEALEVQREVGDTWGMGRVYAYLGEVALQQGDPSRAEDLCEQGLPLSRTVEDAWGVALSLETLGGVELARGRLERSAGLLSEAVVMFRDVGARDRVAQCLQDFATLALRQGQVERATLLSAAAEATQQRIRLAFWPAVEARRQHDIAEARARLGETAYERARAEGLQWPIERAVDYALAGAETDDSAS